MLADKRYDNLNWRLDSLLLMSCDATQPGLKHVLGVLVLQAVMLNEDKPLRPRPRPRTISESIDTYVHLINL